MATKDRSLTRFPFDPADAKLLEDETGYQGYGRLAKLTVLHSLFGGGTSEILTREMFDTGDAVIVFPFDPTRQSVLLIEQFRAAPLYRGDHPWMIEGVAGRIEDGESKQEVARRESLEEAGCSLQDIEEIGTFYQSPGIFAERITYFCAKADLSRAGGIHGLDHENEDIRALVVPLDKAVDAALSNAIPNAPTTLGLLWLERNRERLTEKWGP